MAWNEIIVTPIAAAAGALVTAFIGPAAVPFGLLIGGVIGSENADKIMTDLGMNLEGDTPSP